MCFYVSSSIHSKPTYSTEPALESIFLEVSLPSGGTLLLTGAYRPPDSPVSFWTCLETWIDNCLCNCPQQYSDSLCVLGDLNVNTLGSANHHSAHYHNFCRTFLISNIVDMPTRFPSMSCLDHFLSPISGSICPAVTVVPTCVVSDHFLVLTSMNQRVKDRPTQCLVSTRKPLGSSNRMEFNRDLSTALESASSEISESMTLDEVSSIWQSAVLSVYNSHCPVRRKPKRNGPMPQPWVDTNLRNLLHQRKHLHRAVIKNPGDQLLLQQFRSIRRQGNLMNKRLRSAYFQQEFATARNNPRKQWKLINTLTGRAKPRQPPLATVNQLTTSFSRTVSSHPTAPPLAVPHGPGPREGLSAFKPVTPAAVKSYLLKLSAAKSTGPDQIPAALLKTHADVLSHTLSGLLTESLIDGVVPSAYKIASIKPIFKKGDRHNAANYRPISLLPIVSKVLEHIVHEQLTAHLTRIGSILPDQQFAYRRLHSCEDALCLCISHWQKSLDQGSITGVLLVDMSKAFDTVNHSVLLQDLLSSGVTGTALHWFWSYLTLRFANVSTSSGESGPTFACTRGVPQGSVLGPLLFSLYLREAPGVVKRSGCNSLLYADDINIYYSSRSVVSVTDRLTAAASDLEEYLVSRSLIINPSKTEFMLVRPKSVCTPSDTTVRVAGSTISPKPTAKYLGLLLDEHLDFTDHINQLTVTVNQKLGAFRRRRSALTPAARRMFYLSIIQSTIMYSSIAYVHSISAPLYQRLIKLCKRSLRIVFGYSPTTSSHFILSRHKINSIDSQFQLKLFVFIFRCLHSLTSPLLSELFLTRSAATHTSSVTRSQTQDALAIPHAKGKVGRSSLPFICASKWNALPADIRTQPTLSLFISSYKSFAGIHVRRP